MLTGKVLFMFLGLLLAVLTLCNVELTQPTIENFWSTPGFHVRAWKQAERQNGQTTAISNYTGMTANAATMGAQQKGQFFSTPSFQPMIAPRFDAQGYGTFIKYNMPDRANQAVPCDPLTYGDMASEGYRPTQNMPRIPTAPVASSASVASVAPQQVKEGYGCSSSSCSIPSCGKAGIGIGHKIEPDYMIQSGYANGNYQDVYDSLPGAKISHSALPVATMTTMDGAGDTEQVVITDRLMFANIRGRGLQGSDYIRGDLAITPCANGWFSVYPNIATEVNTGAMKVMFGDGETASNTINLVAQASGGSITALSGVNMSEPQYRPQITGAMTPALSAQNADISVSAFP